MTYPDDAHPKSWWQLFGRAAAADCAASVAAGTALGVVSLAFAFDMSPLQAFNGSLFFGLVQSPFIAVLAFLPSMAALAVVKALGVRRGISDTIAGGLIGAALITLLYQLGSNSFDLGRVDLIDAARYGIAGLVGGFAYWFVAGRPRSRHQAAADRHPIDPSIFD